MNSARGFLRVAAVASSVLLIAGFVWFHARGQPTESAPAAPAVAPAPVDANLYEKPATAADVKLVNDRTLMPGSKSGGTAPIGEPKSGYVFKVLTAQGESANPTNVPATTERVLMPGSKVKSQVIEPGDIKQVLEKKERTLMPGSKKANTVIDPEVLKQTLEKYEREKQLQGETKP